MYSNFRLFHRGAVLDIAYSSNGVLVSARVDSTLRFWLPDLRQYKLQKITETKLTETSGSK